MDKKREISSARMDSASGPKININQISNTGKPLLGGKDDLHEGKDEKTTTKKIRITRGGAEKTLA